MTEADWLACTDPEKMVKLFRARRLEGRLRRFAVECCRRVRYLITEEAFRAAADASEAFADDPRNERSTIKAMAQAALEAWRYRRQYASSANRYQLRAADTAIASCAPTAWGAAVNAMREAARAANRANADSCDTAELRYQAAILRCLFGPLPFRTVTADRVWVTPTVEQLARASDVERSFDLLPILADALEDAGCRDPDILGHLRGGGPHVRGCWVIDLLLGKE
jgi:hypothetical protein